MLPAKVGSFIALLIALLPLSVAADEPFVGYEARYIPIVEFNGQRVETEGQLEITFYQTCDSLYYSWNESRDVTLLEMVESLHNSGVWHEKLDGTSGTSHMFTQYLELVDNEIVGANVVNFVGKFERVSSLWEGDVELVQNRYDIEITYDMPLPENVLTPALAYKSMADRIAAGETSFTHNVSVIGVLDSIDPEYSTNVPVTVEIVPSPFEGYELPQTPDGLFDGEFQVILISHPGKAMIYQLFENGLRGWTLMQSKTHRYLYQPVTANAVEPKPCD